MADFTGTTGDDTQDGTNAADVFDYSQGGNDTLRGLKGDDTFLMGAVLTSADSIVGGRGNDTVVLDGDYNVTFAATTILNIETIRLTAGHDYTINTAEESVGAGRTLTIDATALGTDDALVFHAFFETDGLLHVMGGLGNDVIVGGAQADIVNGNAGDDSIDGGDGDDQLGGRLGNDTIYGGAGNDSVGGGDGSDILDGGDENDSLFGGDGNDHLSGGMGLNVLDGGSGNDELDSRGGDEIFGGTGDDSIKVGTRQSLHTSVDAGSGDDVVTFKSYGTIYTDLRGGDGFDTLRFTFSHKLSIKDFSAVSTGFEAIASGGTLVFDDQDNFVDLSGFILQPQARFDVTGGIGNDTLIGNRFSDQLEGGDGDDSIMGGDDYFQADWLDGGLGADTIDPGHDQARLVYHSVAESTSLSHDVIIGFSAGGCRFDIDETVNGVDDAVQDGKLSNETFDLDMMSEIDSGHLGRRHAVLFTPDEGDLAGRTFLIIDANNQAGYQASADYVMELQDPHYLGLTADDFI